MLHTEEGVEGVDEAIYIDKRMTLRMKKSTSKICASLMRSMCKPWKIWVTLKLADSNNFWQWKNGSRLPYLRRPRIKRQFISKCRCSLESLRLRARRCYLAMFIDSTMLRPTAPGKVLECDAFPMKNIRLQNSQWLDVPLQLEATLEWEFRRWIPDAHATLSYPETIQRICLWNHSHHCTLSRRSYK